MIEMCGTTIYKEALLIVHLMNSKIAEQYFNFVQSRHTSGINSIHIIGESGGAGIRKVNFF